MDTLRLAVAPAFVGWGVAVAVYVNDIDLTEWGGVGLDPDALVSPVNRLLPADQPEPVVISCCACGSFECDGTAVVVSRAGDVVHWDFEGEEPMDRPAMFAADAYVAEVTRVAAERSWETPERTAARLLRDAEDDASLARYGLYATWAADDPDDAGTFLVGVGLPNYEIAVRVPWEGRTPEQLRDAAVALLCDAPPAEWPAQWRAVAPTRLVPPIAGPGWVPWPV